MLALSGEIGDIMLYCLSWFPQNRNLSRYRNLAGICCGAVSASSSMK